MKSKLLTVKLFLLLTAMMFITNMGYSRDYDSYFWGNYTKIPISKDYTIMSLFFKPEFAHLNDRFIYQQNEKIKKFDIYRNGEMTIISFCKLVHAGIIMEELFGHNDKWISGYANGYSGIGNEKLWVTPRLVLRLKKGHTLDEISSLMNMYNLEFVRESYGQVILQTTNLDKIVEAANKIHESEYVEWCHPDFYTSTARDASPIFPNPASDILKIDLNLQMEILTSIYFSDSNGRVLWEELETPVQEHHVDVSRYHEGIYMLKVVNSCSADNYKIVISR